MKIVTLIIHGKFNSLTYNSLVNLVVELCQKYKLTADDVIRHYDVTWNMCPKYYVQNPSEWVKFKQEIKIRLDEGGDEPMRIYQNGSTPEPVYSDTDCTKKIGSLDARERCDCYGIFMNRAVVRYHVNGTSNYKVGFCKWLGGVK